MFKRGWCGKAGSSNSSAFMAESLRPSLACCSQCFGESGVGKRGLPICPHLWPKVCRPLAPAHIFQPTIRGGAVHKTAGSIDVSCLLQEVCHAPGPRSHCNPRPRKKGSMTWAGAGRTPNFLTRCMLSTPTQDEDTHEPQEPGHASSTNPARINLESSKDPYRSPRNSKTRARKSRPNPR